MKRWLDKYNDGGPVQENYNNASVFLPDGFVGMGYNTQGRNYSPAWGGQFKDGGELTPEQLAFLNRAKMRSKMALASEFGNPSAKRMTSVSPSSYRFSGNEMIGGESVGVRPGETGTHFMSSMGEYVVPFIQEGPDGNLQFNPNASPRDREAIRFDNPQDAQYFAEHYKEVAPMMRNFAMGGSLPQAQDGWLEKLKGSVLNPYNWGVEDYSKEKDFTKAYSTAKKAGEEEFMYKGKRYNTKYAGTPRQEVGTYGADGKPVSRKNIAFPTQTNLYPPFGKYLPGHISSQLLEKGLPSIDYSSAGNNIYGIGSATKKGEKSYYSYGVDPNKFYDVAAKLPYGIYDIESGKPSTWNLFTNNCADNVCDAFGIPRSKGIQTPTGAVSKIKEKYPTIDVTGRTYDDYENLYRNLQDQPNKKILSQSKDILGIASSPDLQETDISKKLISTIQGVLADEGFAPSKSQKQSGGYDGVYGPETKKALEDWQKKNKNKSLAMGGSLPGAVGFTYARTAGAAPSNGPYAKKTKASAQKGKEMSYYQHGLDWKPKNISRDGSDVPKNQNAKYTLPSESTALAKPKFTEAQYAEQLNEKNKRKEFEKYITSQPQIKQGKKEISNTTDNSGRSFWETASQFIPVYEQFLDIKDIVQGAFTGDTEMRNRGILGTGAPVSGKALMGGLDYLTEKTQGKETADYNEEKRKTIVNSPTFNRALFEKYGWGGYDKWVKAGKPPLYEQGGIVKAQKGTELTPIKRVSLDEQMANLRAKQQRTSDAPSVNLAESEKRRIAEARQKADAKRTFISQGRQETPQEKANTQRLREQYQLLHPNTEINPYTGELQTINPDRGFEMQPLTPNTERFDKGLEHIMTGLDAAGYAEGLGALGKVGYNAAKKALAESMESGLLSNTYKLNPWAFKPNTTSAYRMIGNEEGLASTLESGYLKPSTTGSDIGKIHTNAHYTMGAPSDARKYFGRTWNREYPGPYMAEVPNAINDVRISQGIGGKEMGADVFTFPENYIPTSEANLYKQDWLRGYKEVPKPKSLSSSVENVGAKKGFSLNYEKILNLPDEEILSKTGRSKEDWELYINHDAKHADKFRNLLEEQFNSAYTPTEQQLQSIDQGKNQLLNFYKSSEYNNRLQRGMGLDYNEAFNYQNNLIDAVNKTQPRFIKSKNMGSLESDAMAYTKGFNSKGTTLGIDFSKTGLERSDAPYLASHEFGHTSVYDAKNQKILENLPKLNLDAETLENWTKWGKESGNKVYDDMIKYYGNPDEARQRGINAILYSKNKGISLDELVDMPYSEVVNKNKTGEIPSDILQLRQFYNQKELKDYLKNLFSISGVSAVSAAVALQQKKKGGVIKDDRGQWAHPGEITEIGSNRITMQGVPYPVLGISDEGDQQMMYPEQEYKFKGKKVTEYPMKKNGGWLDKYN
jgi:hypothetical protein